MPNIQKTDGDIILSSHEVNPHSAAIIISDNITSTEKFNKLDSNAQSALDSVIGKMLQHPCYMFSSVYLEGGNIYFTFSNQKYRLVLQNV
jgi:hypothetical protein